MPDPNAYNLSSSQLEDGTIDFYTLLDESPSASADALRTKIQGLYSDAQANRDHRNLNKRREYQALLELLPTARGVLLEDPKRARYDLYLSAAKVGKSPGNFETFINDLMGLEEPLEGKTAVLGVQEPKQDKEVRARVIKTPAPTPTASTTPSRSSSASGGGAPARVPQSSSSGGGNSGALIGAVGGLLVGAIIGWFVFKIIGAIGLGLVFAAIGFALLNKPKRRVGL